jgi:ATP-dependent Clp protease ATP-binding subunit ClpB
MFTQEALEKFHTEKLKLSVVLFDEIEKSSDTLWNLLLGILDKAVLTLGDNRKVDFSRVIVLMTSNLGSAEMVNLTSGGMGFVHQGILDAVHDSKISDIAKEAAKRRFSPEFFNRLNNVAVFNTLTEEQIGKILDIELGALQTRLLLNSRVQFFFAVKQNAKAVIIKEGYDKSYGARHLKRAIDQRVLIPLARLVSSGQILDKDVILIDEVGKAEFEFTIVEG